MDPSPWKCPECRAWVPPHVSAHRCDEPGAGEAAKPVPSDPVPVTTAGGAAKLGYTCVGCRCFILLGQMHYCPGLLIGTGGTGVNTSYFVACPSCGVLTNDIAAHQCMGSLRIWSGPNPVKLSESKGIPFLSGGTLYDGTSYGVSYAPNESGGLTTEVHIFHA